MAKANTARLVASAIAATLLLSACATAPALTGEETDASDSRGMTIGVGTPVLAAAETVAVGTANADAADDPAIWVDRADPGRAILFGTDKKAGLYTYRLDGTVLQNLDGGMPNNVDLREGFMVDGRPHLLVATSDRSPGRFGIALFLTDQQTLQTWFWGVIPSDLTEPYGLCVGRYGSDFVVIVNGTDGQVRQVAITVGPDGAPVGTERKRYALSSQTEGCVIDDTTGLVYIGEEAKGIWRFSLDPTYTHRLHLARAPSPELAPDVEGLAMIRDAGRTFLLASSQGDSAFAIWRVDGPDAQYAGRFSVVSGNGIDAVTGTDGITAIEGPIGAYAQGLIMVQDDVDELPGRTGERQNFKLVDWTAIKTALGID